MTPEHISAPQFTQRIDRLLHQGVSPSILILTLARSHIVAQIIMDRAALILKETSPNPTPEPTPNHKIILLAEDNSGIRHFLTLDLEESGFTVIPAENGQEALDTLRQLHQEGHPPDLVLSDIRMPHMNGVEFHQHAKKEGLINCPWLIHTSIITDKSIGAYFASERVEVMETNTAEFLLPIIHNLLSPEKDQSPQI